MFYYRFITTKKHREGTRQTITRHVDVREVVRRADLGEHVVGMMASSPDRLVVERITQQQYKNAAVARRQNR